MKTQSHFIVINITDTPPYPLSPPLSPSFPSFSSYSWLRNYISAIYPSEVELKDTTLTSNEVCYLDTRIRNGDNNTPFHLSVYDKRDDFSFRIVNFPHMDSNIPANPAYGVFISQLVRYARLCTSKLDFIDRPHRLSSHLLHPGFNSTLLRKSLIKFLKRHGAIVEKYGATLQEMRLTIQR